VSSSPAHAVSGQDEEPTGSRPRGPVESRTAAVKLAGMTTTAMSDTDVAAEVGSVVDRARAAMREIEHYTQEQVDALVTAVAWSVVRPDHAEALATAAVDEGGFGNYADKVVKINKRVVGVLDDMTGVGTVGVVESLPDKGIVKIAKPVGVVAALIPTTGPDATPPVKTLFALKGRNAIVVAPHPRTRRSTEAVVAYMREACVQVGAPADLVQSLPEPSLPKTRELMRQADLVVATGGAGMVRAAYSSGTPAYGVGVGNSVHVVDDTVDDAGLADAVASIAAAKTFDYATSCLADNAVVAHESVYDRLVAGLAAAGGHVCDAGERDALRDAMWPDGGEIPSIKVIAKPATEIAALAGFATDGTFLVVEESGVGPEHPFSGEKLSVVLAVYRYSGGIENAAALVNEITAYQGLGHTCGIHTTADANVDVLAATTRTARVMVNQNLNEGAGSARNGLPFTLSLSCGTWGGNITTENVNARHFVNLTWVSRPIEPRVISEDRLFADHWARYGR
jgi:acyl-CoA reductase-like NAD-dependent aldehyde dehydrogenase